MNAGIMYHPDYNKYDLGLDHPLIGEKPKMILEFLKNKKLLQKLTVFTPTPATTQDLLRVHNPLYVDRIKNLSKNGGMLAADTPAPKGIYDIALLSTGGTKQAGKHLYENYQIMMNPLAGFHHASQSHSSGFCFFNDIAVVIEYLKATQNLQRTLIVDLDVHHANGTQDIYYEDPSVLNLSFHQDGRTLYPGTGAIDKIGRYSGEGYTINLPLPPGTGNTSYLYALNTLLPPLCKQYKPELIIYQSGVDTHYSDPLADLNLTYDVYYHIAQLIQQLSKKSCNKLLVLFGGGYNTQASLISYYNIICGFLNKNSYIPEEPRSDLRENHVRNLVNEIINILESHWNF